MVVIDFASLPTDHPIRLYCRKWDIQNWKAQEELVVLAKELIAFTVRRVIEDKETTT